MRRAGSRSRSRGRRPSGRDRDWRASRSDRGGYPRDGRDERPRDPRDVRSSRDAPQANHATSAAKSGQQKAKEAMAKEKEKAMLKKQQREKEQQDRLAQKEQDKARIEETLRSDIANAGALAIASNSSTAADGDKLKIHAMSPEEQKKEQAAAAAAAAAASIADSLKEREKAVASREPVARPCDEASLRILYQLLDRSGKDAVSKRDVLVALKKHAPVRVLFGLPVGSAGDGDDLQARINAIQDAFESSSSLGEAGTIFEELLAAAGGGAQQVAWAGFLSYCQQDRLRECMCKAVSLLPREHAVGVAFQATHDWQVVPEGAACGTGLEFKMDLATGKTLGRLARSK